jgi:1-pyrroline-5-carboxylate dehydrogenase
MLKDIASFSVGPVEDFRNFVNAVIDEKSFDKIAKYIDEAKNDASCEIVSGGTYNKSKGWFIDPTVIVTSNPKYTTMCEELFGPVLTIYVYDADRFEETLELVDSTSEYALTGAILSQDRYAIDLATWKLRNSAGNFYINDKPTGAVVGQQPFGGARASGTNDKAGAMINLMRWVSQRTIKETFVSPERYEYEFMKEA